MGDQQFSWDSLGEEGEHYVAISPILLKLIRETAWIHQLDPHVLPTVRLLLRVARVDPVTGNLVIGVKFLRELGEGGTGP